MTTTKQLARVVGILRRLPRSPKTISTPKLHDKLSRAGYVIPIRILHNDLNRIAVELPVLKTPGKPTGWSWTAKDAPFDAVALEPAGALVMALMQPTMRALLPARHLAHFEQLLSGALESAEAEGYARLIRNVRVLHEPLPRLPPVPRPGLLDTLMNAIVLGRRVNARYKKRNAPAPSDYHLGPLSLVAVGPRLILLANKVGAANVRHYEVQRFSSVRLASGATEGIDDFDVDAHIASGELAFPITGRPVELVLELSAEHEDELIDSPLAPDQEISGPAGARRLTATVIDTWALKRFLLGLGRDAKVLAPANYRAQMADEVAAMAARYGVAGVDAVDPKDEGALVRGLLVPAKVRSAEVLGLLSELTFQIMGWARGSGALVLGPGYALSGQVGADITVFASGRAEGPPDLVVDVLDGTLDGRARVRKARWYQAQGVGRRWIVDPGERVAMGYEARAGEWAEVDSVDGAGALRVEALGLEVELDF